MASGVPTYRIADLRTRTLSRPAPGLPCLAAERGSILAVLLVTATVGVMVVFLLTNAAVDLMIASNDHEDRQAFYLADAGYRHAVQAMTNGGDSLEEYLDGPDGTRDTADDGQVLGPVPIALADGTYEVRLEPGTGNGPPAFLVSEGRVRAAVTRLRVAVAEGAGSTYDGSYLFNNRLTASTGHISFYDLAPVHSNDSLDLHAGMFFGGQVTTSGAFDTDDGIFFDGEEYSGADLDDYIATHSNADVIDVPEIDPHDFEHLTDFRLAADGNVYDGSGNLIDGDGDWYNLSFDGETWRGHDVPTTLPGGTYFVEGNLILDGHSGTIDNPLAMTVLATGSVKTSGHTYFSSYTQDSLVVTGGDLDMKGHSAAVQQVGHVLVHEQLKFGGHVWLAGGIIVEDAEDLSDFIHRSDKGTEMGGHVELSVSDDLTPLPFGGDGYRAVSWFQES